MRLRGRPQPPRETRTICPDAAGRLRFRNCATPGDHATLACSRACWERLPDLFAGEDYWRDARQKNQTPRREAGIPPALSAGLSRSKTEATGTQRGAAKPFADDSCYPPFLSASTPGDGASPVRNCWANMKAASPKARP